MATPAPNTTTQQQVQSSTPEVLPAAATLLQAAKIAIEQDRPIMLDYYRQTVKGTAFIGEDPETKQRVLVKSKDEFTSLIKKMGQVGEDIIILTENSLYVVSKNIKKKGVSLASLQEAQDDE